MPSVRKDTRQFYSPYGEWYCFAVVFVFDKWYLLRKFLANKISLKPQASISLCRRHNITLSTGKNITEKSALTHHLWW